MNKKMHDLILDQFEAIAKEYNFERKKDLFRGQNDGDKKVIGGNVYFEFGDLRISLRTTSSTHHVIIEVDNSPSIVNNILKYWYMLEKKIVKNKISLIHLFNRKASKSKKDLEANIELWKFINGKMEENLVNKFKGNLFIFGDIGDERYTEFIKEFKNLITNH